MAAQSMPGRAGAVLRHPGTLLIAGALISSYLIPSFTRGWQDHQKELELKSALVTDITQSSTSMLLTVRFAHYDEPGDAGTLNNPGWRVWQIQSAVIASRLRAYFPHTSLADDWTGYRDEVDVFNNASTDQKALWCAHAALLATSPAAREDERQEGGVPLKSPIHLDCNSVGVLPVTTAVRSSTGDPEWEWSAVEREMYARRDELVKRVLDAHVNSF